MKNSEIVECTFYKINLFQRLGQLDKVRSTFINEIDNFSKNPSIASHLAIRYSRFVHKVLKDEKEAKEILRKAITCYPSNCSLYLQLIDIAYQQKDVQVDEILSYFDECIAVASKQSKIIMMRKKQEFMQDFGCSSKM